MVSIVNMVQWTGDALKEKTGGKTEITERDTNLVRIFRSVVLQMLCLTAW